MKKKMSKTALNILSALNESLDYERGNKKLRKTEVELPGPASRWTAKKIKALRTKFGVSQPIFATILNVSPETVRAWEQGQKSPSGPTRRLLDVAANRPSALFEASSTLRQAKG